jgi:hypothetical protein
MIKAKYFREYISNDIDSRINQWLKGIEDISIIDIKMKVSGSYVYVLIFYEIRRKRK